METKQMIENRSYSSLSQTINVKNIFTRLQNEYIYIQIKHCF